MRGEEKDESSTKRLQGLVSKERKELAVIGVVVEDDNVVALKHCCSQRDASISGVGLFMKMSNNGTHASIFCWLPSSSWRESAGKPLLVSSENKIDR